jgi:serine/threonine-protein phosphatase PP1 catalytic subunit
MSQSRAILRAQLQKVDVILGKLNRFGRCKVPGVSSITTQDLTWLAMQVKPIFAGQPTLLQVSAPVTICGDIHGQFFDLLRIFELGGSPEVRGYVFLGDYVDRGANSIEVIAYLFCMKVKFPERVWLLRGNHESNDRDNNRFYTEFKERKCEPTFYTIVDVFRWLPIAAVVGRRIFCVHGGLSPQLHDLSQILNMKRPLDLTDPGLLIDLLWSDPAPQGNGWQESERQIACTYGPDVVDDFLMKQKLDLLCRAHQNVDDGYEFPFGSVKNCVTVFSAPDYCEMKNYGAVLKVEDDLTCSFEYLEPLFTSTEEATEEECDVVA